MEGEADKSVAVLKAVMSRGASLRPLHDLHEFVARQVLETCIASFEKGKAIDTAKQLPLLLNKVSKPKVRTRGDIAVPVFTLAKPLGMKPPAIAAALLEPLQLRVKENVSDMQGYISELNVEGSFLNFTIAMPYLTRVVPAILNNNYLDRISPVEANKEKTMIEYSQPNTHKAFHVGHMRNAALGDCLVRLHEQIGHEVVPVNYFGDEGAHVARCLWQLEKMLSEEGLTLDGLKKRVQESGAPLGEYLGKIYSAATDLLDLSAMTKHPYPGVFTAKVLSKTALEDGMPPNWRLLSLEVGPGETTQVVCGGTGYAEGSVVAYIPVGGIWKRERIAPRDMKGIASHGMVVARSELGIKANPKEIYVLPSDTPVGIELTEVEKLVQVPHVGKELARRKAEVEAVLERMEQGEPAMMALWDATKMWSLDEFRDIYAWLDCRFDHDFFESDVGEESRQLVLKHLDKGTLVRSEGAVGADLTAYNMPFCILLRGNGTGLYATKDLALAHRKFTEFAIEKSVYVVDAAQSLHFQQVFKVLELMGYKDASKCFHLPYGQVRLPDGKMSSRKGNVKYFSLLKETLGTQIRTDFLAKYVEEWSPEEVAAAEHALSVATIKYGMLRTDPAKDIVFKMEEWAARSGETGVYLMYALSRLNSILNKVPEPENGSFKPELLLLNKNEREVLLKLNHFWETVEVATAEYKPSTFCTYLYELCKLVMTWYETADVKNSEDDLKKTRLLFCRAVATTIKRGLWLIGIKSIKRM